MPAPKLVDHMADMVSACNEYQEGLLHWEEVKHKLILTISHMTRSDIDRLSGILFDNITVDETPDDVFESEDEG